MMVLVELRTYSNTLGDSTARQFCHMQPSALAHVEATMGDMFGAIRADGTLGGLVHATFVPSISGYAQYEMGETLAYMGATVRAEIWAT